MIGDVIETFRIDTPTVNQKSVQNVGLKQLPITVPQTFNLCSQMLAF